MNRMRVGMIAALLMSLAVVLYARQPGQDSGAQHEEPKKEQEVAPATRKSEVNPPRGQEETKQPNKQTEGKPPKTEKPESTQPQKAEKPGHGEHGVQAQQGKMRQAGKSAHIPDPQFKANFGQKHTFAVNRVITTTTIVPNQTQFIFAGYTFIFLDPWPDAWLLTDGCYIDFVDDEYFLFDAFHPGIRIALFVVE